MHKYTVRTDFMSDIIHISTTFSCDKDMKSKYRIIGFTRFRIKYSGLICYETELTRTGGF